MPESNALGQIVRLRTGSQQKRGDILHGLNDRLPPDINVLKVEDAHSRSIRDETLSPVTTFYQISTRRTAFAKRFVWWVKDKLDARAIEQATESLPGRHDFARFCDKRTGDASTIVVVNEVQFARDGDLLLFRIGRRIFFLENGETSCGRAG